MALRVRAICEQALATSACSLVTNGVFNPRISFNHGDIDERQFINLLTIKNIDNPTFNRVGIVRNS